MTKQIQLKKNFQYNGESTAENRFINGQLTSQQHQYFYKGQFEDYLQDGQGYERYKELEYDGYFKNGKKQGEGTMKYSNCTYVGSFENGVPHGSGELFLPEDEIIQGTFQKGQISNGKMLFKIKDKQYSYLGNFKSFQKNGEGKIYKTDEINEQNLIYTGTFKNNYPIEEGLLYQDGKQIFKGDVNKNLFPVNGYLDIQNNIGEYYKGGWQREKKNGEGHFIYKNKSEYKGHWQDGSRHGYGVFIENDGEKQMGIYKGYFINNRREDQRQFFFSDETEARKQFLKKKKESDIADSTYTWDKNVMDKNGNQRQQNYIGNWKSGFMDGKGYIDMVNYKYEGHFSKSQKEGKGKITLQNQDYYQGNFKNDKFDGKGQFCFVETGGFYNGEWSSIQGLQEFSKQQESKRRLEEQQNFQQEEEEFQKRLRELEEERIRKEEEERKKKEEEANKRPNYVVRKEIREMSKREQQRFINACKKLCEGNPEESEFFKIAGYHGWPSNYCHHGQETFPSWHRAYLVCFERAIIKADLELGNDGDIGLPYWDWSREDVNGEYFPKILREQWIELPDGFFKKSTNNKLAQKQFKTRRSDYQIKKRNEKAQIVKQANDVLLERTHWKFASTRFKSGVSVETPHNSMHMSCGFPMTSLSYAAFALEFWLHHNNIDRICEKYNQTYADSAEEFSNQQQNLVENKGEKDRFNEPLKPFNHPFEDRYIMPNDCYQDTKTLGFVYDKLPDLPPQKIREFPTLALFQNILKLDLKEKSYELHVFIVKKGENWVRNENPDEFEYMENYGGWCGIFGGKGKECGNCQEKIPFDVHVEITQTLNNMNLTKYEVELKVIAIDEDDNIMRIEDCPGVPLPIISGPYFSQPLNLSQQKEKQGDIEQLQKLLKNLGLYKDCDGQFGPITEDAVKKLQKKYGLEQDGNVGPLTQKLITSYHIFSNKELDENSKANYKNKPHITYYVGPNPGKNKRSIILEEIAYCFKKWIKTGVLKSAQLITNKNQADIVIKWTDRSSDNQFIFDSKGGNLAHSDKGFIDLDDSEDWCIQGDSPQKGQFQIFTVVLHEIGHALGLSHSENPNDLMAPYYVENKNDLTFNDIIRMQSLYGLEQ